MSAQISSLLHKHSCKIIAVLFLLFSQSSIFSQVDTSVYYPLAKGNKWEYFYQLWYPYDYTWLQHEVIKDTLLSNGKNYWKIKETIISTNEVNSRYYYQRVENKYRVLGYIDSSLNCGTDEKLLFDFSSPVKHLWQVCGGYEGVKYYVGNLNRRFLDFSNYKNLDCVDLYYNVRITEKNGKIDTVWAIVDAFNYHSVLKGIGIIRYQEVYSLQAYLINGEQYGTFTDVKGDKSVKPSSFHLYPAYPNPFNPVTKIEFTLPKSGVVKLEVFDIIGRKIRELVNGELDAGLHSVEFNGANLSSGVYYYRLTANGLSEINKAILLK